MVGLILRFVWIVNMVEVFGDFFMEIKERLLFVDI